MRLRAVPVRLTPTEVLLLAGLMGESLHVRCDSVEECDGLWKALEALKRGEPVEDPALLKRLRAAGVLDAEAEAAAEVVGDGVLAEELKALLPPPGGRPALRVLAMDFWSPSALRSAEAEALREGVDLLPAFAAFDTVVVGPLVRRGYPGYRCLEDQLTASGGWVARLVRDFADRGGRWGLDRAGARLAASLTALVLRRDPALLLGRAVVVDLATVFIDVVRVLATPGCLPTPPAAAP